jgi:hypothetical protein
VNSDFVSVIDNNRPFYFNCQGYAIKHYFADDSRLFCVIHQNRFSSPLFRVSGKNFAEKQANSVAKK